MSERCEICRKELARIMIDGKHAYCFDCYNQMMLEQSGRVDTFSYAKTMSVMEPGGTMHSFRISHVILGDIVSWDAEEIDGNYHFHEISEPDEDGSRVAQRFFKKIVKAVCSKTLSEDGYSVKDKGVIHVIDVVNGEYTPGFRIDDREFTPQELGRLFESYTGFVINYQIHDASDPIPGEHDYLVPVHITKKTLLEDLERIISIHGNNDFISYKQVPAFDESFYAIVDRLGIMFNAGDRDYARKAALEIIKRLKTLNTDDDDFPRIEAGFVWRRVDPYGTDDGLYKEMEKWD